MKKSWFFLDDDALLAFAASVGLKLTAYVDAVEMVDENSMARRWATASCHILEEKYSGLTEDELGWLVKGMIGDMLRRTFWGHEFLVEARVHLYSGEEVKIAYLTEVFE